MQMTLNMRYRNTRVDNDVIRSYNSYRRHVEGILCCSSTAS